MTVGGWSNGIESEKKNSKTCKLQKQNPFTCSYTTELKLEKRVRDDDTFQLIYPNHDVTECRRENSSQHSRTFNSLQQKLFDLTAYTGANDDDGNCEKEKYGAKQLSSFIFFF